MLCVNDADRPVVLERVRYREAPRPLKIDTFIRQVPDVADQQVGQAIEWAPVYGALGDIRDEGQRFRGEIKAIVNAEIGQPCTEAGVGDSGFTELVTVLTVDERGGAAREAMVDYSVEGRRYTLTIDWQMVACGSQVDPSIDCSP